nr:hypothetical protein GCM10020185_40670 [Pseudomonas brassicacearum subsp. brassicacearum]
MFLGGNLLSRSVLAAAVSEGNSRLLGFNSIAAATADTITLPPGYKSSVLISWGQPLQKKMHRPSTPVAMAPPAHRKCSSATTTTA